MKQHIKEDVSLDKLDRFTFRRNLKLRSPACIISSVKFETTEVLFF